jgi:hypothetical protein
MHGNLMRERLGMGRWREVLAALAMTFTAPVSADTSLCCPADITGNGIVNSADLGILLSAWGANGKGEAGADIDGDGDVGSTDLSALLSAWGNCPVSCTLTRIVGEVTWGAGVPVVGAVVSTDVGGSAVADSAGRYAFVVDVPAGTRSLTATASIRLDGTVFTGSASTTSIILDGDTILAPITLQDAPCPKPAWQQMFGGLPGVDGLISAHAVFDDGTGPKLYVGGFFSVAGGRSVANLACWNGIEWQSVGGGVTGAVGALAVHDDGTGPKLVVGGTFTHAGGIPASNLASWDGSQWSPVGSGLNGAVLALHSVVDGESRVLYVGGEFTAAGSVSVLRIARWNGLVWAPVGAGFNGTVFGITSHTVESSSGIVAVGDFTSSGTTSAKRIARWNGQSWTSFGTGMNFTVWDAIQISSGPAAGLYAVGTFTNAGSTPANRIARWNGSSWQSVGTGLSGSSAYALFIDTASTASPSLVVGGDFCTAGGIASCRIARWDGQAWSAMGVGMNAEQPSSGLSVRSIGYFNFGAGEQLIAGGVFTDAAGAGVGNIARLTPSGWRALGTGLSGRVAAACSFQSAGEERLVVAGDFTGAGGGRARRVAMWGADGWQPLGAELGSGMSGYVTSLAVYDSGTGPSLYAGGSFSVSGADHVARWDGTTWLPVGGGLGGSITNQPVECLAVYDDGAGPKLVAGGWFTTGGANRIARWNGAVWSPLSTGMNGTVYCLAVYNDGTGPALYAGGNFTMAGGQVANYIARWNGVSWTAVGSGMDGPVYALAVHNDGSGDKLYAGGEFLAAGGVVANRLARWNGSSWSVLPGQPNNTVFSIASHDRGDGPELIIGGAFTALGSSSHQRIAAWDGVEWRSMAPGFSQSVVVLRSVPFGLRRQLIAGGDFKITPSGDSYVASWRCDD